MRIGEPFDLASGTAYVRLAAGVQLMIECPARWEFTSQQRIFFHSGRLMAQVPRAAVGFTVATPTAEVVDLGTEFGVVVDEQNTTDVVVSWPGGHHAAGLARRPRRSSSICRRSWSGQVNRTASLPRG